MALSPWAERLVPELSRRLGAIGVLTGAIPAFAAQLDIETAGGTSRVVRELNNPAGIGGRSSYRRYSTLAEGLGGYVTLLQNQRYAPVIAAGRTGDPVAVAVALGKSPWAAHHYRLGASGDEAQGSSGRIGTEGYAIVSRFGGTIPGSQSTQNPTASLGAADRLKASGTTGAVTIPTTDQAASLLSVEAFSRLGVADMWTAGNIDLTIDKVSEIQLSFDDPGLKMAGQIKTGSRLSWGQWPLEIVAIETGPGVSGRGGLTVTAHSQLAQSLKTTRPKNLSYPQMSVAGVLRNLLSNSGRAHTIQDTPTLTQAVIQVDEKTGKPEFWWDAIQRWAQDPQATGGAEFVSFEAAGVLFFGQPSWLVAACPRIPITISFDELGSPVMDDGIDVLPSVRRTVNDPDAPITISLQVRPQLGARILPGMALDVSMPAGVGVYLVSRVTGPLSANEPWVVEGIQPEDKELAASDTINPVLSGDPGGASLIGSDSTASTAAATKGSTGSAKTAVLPHPATVSAAPSTRGWGSPGTPGSQQGRTFAAQNIVVITAAGIRFSVHRRAAKIMQTLINDIDRLLGVGTLARTPGDDGAFNHRWINIKGVAQVGKLSNHSWGLAVDLDWQSNPQGPRATTFPEAEVNHLLSGKFRGLIQWGLWYSRTPDAMHFEFIGTPEQADQLSAAL